MLEKAMQFEDIKPKEQVNLQNIPMFKYLTAKYFQHERGILRTILIAVVVWHFFNVVIVELIKGLIH